MKRDAFYQKYYTVAMDILWWYSENVYSIIQSFSSIYSIDYKFLSQLLDFFIP